MSQHPRPSRPVATPRRHAAPARRVVARGLPPEVRPLSGLVGRTTDARLAPTLAHRDAPGHLMAGRGLVALLTARGYRVDQR